jgi:glutathione-specific gamma-glutamylcyclotransferase
VRVHTVLGAIRAITFVINRAHERYARFLPDDRIAEVIATAEGWLGPCADYLINTVDHLAALGIHDRPLERLRAQVLAHRSKRASD